LRLISDEELWAKMSKDGLDFVKQMPDEDQASDIVKHFLRQVLRD
jgi:hypothetical protein